MWSIGVVHPCQVRHNLLLDRRNRLHTFFLGFTDLPQEPGQTLITDENTYLLPSPRPHSARGQHLQGTRVRLFRNHKRSRHRRTDPEHAFRSESNSQSRRPVPDDIRRRHILFRGTGAAGIHRHLHQGRILGPDPESISGIRRAVLGSGGYGGPAAGTHSRTGRAGLRTGLIHPRH